MDESLKGVTPVEYFNKIKNLKNGMDTSKLKTFYEQCINYANKYMITGQLSALAKIMFYIDNVEKEYKLLELGVNHFVYKEDVEEYIDKVDSRVVKIIELHNYDREIPDELVDVIANTKSIFDLFYVVFTDYTGKAEKKVEAKMREHDPILFGAFKDEKLKLISNRLYYLGDWIDEYCDLTLEVMIDEYGKVNKGRGLVYSMDGDDISLNHIRNTVNSITINHRGDYVLEKPKPIKNTNILKSIFKTFKMERGTVDDGSKIKSNSMD